MAAGRETPTDAAVASLAAKCSGSKSRRKGKVGERQVVQVARANGHPDAERSWQTPQLDGDIGKLVGHLHLEVRYRQGLSVNAWAAEVEAKARDGRLPVTAYRKNREPWRAVVPLDRLLALIAAKECNCGCGC
jgi:hypothetical protein